MRDLFTEFALTKRKIFRLLDHNELQASESYREIRTKVSWQMKT
ncbi:hypothetical protein COLO4_27680 [Corchorus olitorius]|uniref:Uncharacterized protein n=1 Tax=Corchorus olitorius TaxID=93759 RepID=A0A1R3HQ01_9ROSI|nr:hypothetical protein COLO4_27680 [Corchorus olitorius]